MARSTPAADLDALLAAYSLLGLEYTATPRDAQRAYRNMARRHHPDRVGADSPAYRQATARMAAINAAYELVRHAPLRHHPISSGADPDVPFTQAHTDEAWRRASAARRVDLIVTTVAYALLGALFAFGMVPLLGAAGLSFGASALIALACFAVAINMRRSLDLFVVLDGFAAVARVLLMMR